MILTLKTPPAELPVSLDEAKAHLRGVDASEDEPIRVLIGAATRMIDGRDGWLGRCLVTQVWTLTLDEFPSGRVSGDLKIPLSPVQSVDEIRYLDTAGAGQVWDPAGYDVLPGLQETKIVLPAWGTSWPSIRPGRAGVEIDFTCGYGVADEVPDSIRQALLLTIEAWYDGHDDGALPQAVQWLLNPLKVFV